MSQIKFIDTEDYYYVAICKLTKKEFRDANNSSGSLLRHVQETYSDIDLGSKWKRANYYKQTGNYWFEEYFDIIKRDVVHKQQINEIELVDDYANGYSLEKLCCKYKLGKLKIKEILLNNGVEIKKKGGQKDSTRQPYKSIVKFVEDETTTFKAICKKTGVVFDDFMNKSGVLRRHVEDIYDDIMLSDRYRRMKQYNQTGEYWFEEYFDIVETVKDKLETKKCPYCDWETIDVDNKSGYYQNHMIKKHNINIEEHLSIYPDDSLFFKTHIKNENKIQFLNDKENHVVCQICGEKFQYITEYHVRKHGLTLSEYKEKYGSKIMSNNLKRVFTTNAIKANLTVSKNRFISNLELKIRSFLDDNNILYDTNRKVLNGKEIDILIHDLKIGIEINGCKWHTEFFGRKNKHYHLDKTLTCEKHGYKLIHIFEDEIINNEELVLHKLSNILKLNKCKKIHARKCVLKPIDKKTKKDFCDINHIQGDGPSSQDIGAYYKEELVGVMCFKHNNDGHELTRYCTKKGYKINGLGSKILNYFIKNNEVSKIYSFADRRWTLDKDDNLYTKLGFKLIKITPPDYKVYNDRINKYKRFHKFNFRKNKLIKQYNLDPNLTEKEMLLFIGYDRVWDCGLFKYEFNI